MTFADEVKNAVTPRAALLVIGVLGLQFLFIASYVGALHKPGAGTWVARSIAYFKGNAVTGPLLVLSTWAVAGTLVTLLVAMRRKPDDVAGDTAPFGSNID